MAFFRRRLRDGAVQFLGTNKPQWWEDLLQCTFSAEGGSKQRLLIALRNGYFNAYAEGQSVLKMGFGKEGSPLSPYGRIHRKYVDPEFKGQEYLYFDGQEVRDKSGGLLCRYEGIKTLQRWVDRAKTFAGKEKQGVAAIATQNSNVIDVEMALPADDLPNQVVNGKAISKVAPRMDIVALERTTSGVQLVFYEAKLLSNPELRADDLNPKIFAQLATYANYVSQPPRHQQIIDAYQHTCVFLEQLARMRGHEPNHLIAEAAQSKLLGLDPSPRVVIFGYNSSSAAEGSSWNRHQGALSGKAKILMQPEAADICLPDLSR